MDRTDWSNGNLSREDLPKLIKGFIDILILASGYQSSGRPAHWDSTNINRAFRWALFLEDVFKCLRSSDDRKDYVELINAAFSEIKSIPYFPQGLRHVSPLTLGRPKVLLLKQFLQTLPLRDSHFRAAVTAITEMDIDGLQRISDHFLDVYLKKLSLYASNSSLTWTNCYMEDSPSESSEDTQFMVAGSCADCYFTEIAVQELGKRHLQITSVTAAETGLNVLSKITGKSNWNEVETRAYGDQQQNETMSISMIEQNPIEPLTWNEWKSRSLSYLLNKRTARLASGAKLFFSAPKHQWIDVIERLCISDDSDDDMLEKIEILLLGRIVHKWNLLIKILVSNSYESITISKLHHEVQNLPLQQFRNLFSKEDSNLEENGVLEYLERFLSHHRFHCLLKLPPVLVAMAIPSRSPLFRLYMIELESQIRGNSSAIRCCSFAMDGKMHVECEVAERIWCLYVFHISGSWNEKKLMTYHHCAYNCGGYRVLSTIEIMKFLNSKELQVLKWGRRLTGSSSRSSRSNAITLGNVQRTAPISCYQASYYARQFVWRFKSIWRAALRWRRSSIRYSYDAQSYSKNFDDGNFNDHPSPLAPK